MKRNLSGWGVAGAGLLLMVGGVYAMLSGWDMILLERGWSMFIAGSVAFSSGVVTVALGRVIAHLARLAVLLEAKPGEPLAAPALAPEPEAREEQPVPPPAASRPAAPAPPAPPAATVAPQAPPRPAASLAGRSPLPWLNRSAAETPPQAEQLVEVDRYSAGDATYVMLSDGSVEVHSPAGSQRYASLAALRAEAESGQH